jgi:hypothetical protein
LLVEFDLSVDRFAKTLASHVRTFV